MICWDHLSVSYQKLIAHDCSLLMEMNHVSNAFSLLKVDVADAERITTTAAVNGSEKKNEKG